MHIFVKSSADPRLLGALCKTLSPAGGRWVECCDWDERMDETYAFVRVSFRLESEGTRETVSLLRLGMLSTRFFCLKQATVRHPRYMSLLIFT